MAEHSRYNVGGNEADHKIMPNKLGIHDQKELQDTETVLLADTYEYFLNKLEEGKIKFNTDLIFEIHKYFLDILYTWAGKIRSVELSKKGTLFCPAINIKNELKRFNKLLKEEISEESNDKNDFSKKLAIIHSEFNAIHPFREGNGRTIRLFLELLALKNGYKLIDFKAFNEKDYEEACIMGMSQNYSKMKKLFYKGLRRK